MSGPVRRDRGVGNGPRRLFTAVAVMLLAPALWLASSCSASAEDVGTDTSATAKLDPSLHERLPADIRERGTVRVLTDASYPPIESFDDDGRSIVGVDPDLAAALGTVLGVEFELSNADFGTLLDQVEGGGADLVMSAMTDTVAREQQLDFINYFSAGTSIVVQRGNPELITDLVSLCGHPVAVEAGTTQEALVGRFQAKCDEPIAVITGETNDDALLLLRTGRAIAVLMDFPSAEFLTTAPATHANYEMASTAQYEPGLYGIGVAKDAADLRDAVSEALSRLVDSGVYRDILDRWNVGAGAIQAVSVNAASGS